MMQAQKRRLGRGLAALIGDDVIEAASPEESRGLRHLPIELLHSNPNNPRKQFREEELEDLSKSIREKGLLQPIVVRQRADGEYEIVAGERRWRASQRAGLHELPVLIRDLSDGETLEIALIENIQRSDLNPLEEARAYGQLLEQFSYTQQQLADSVGKSRSHIANTLRLLTLPESVRAYIEDGKLTAGHAQLWLQRIRLPTLPTKSSASDFRCARLNAHAQQPSYLRRARPRPIKRCRYPLP